MNSFIQVCRCVSKELLNWSNKNGGDLVVSGTSDSLRSVPHKTSVTNTSYLFRFTILTPAWSNDDHHRNTPSI